MGIVQIPLLDISAPIAAAIQAMREHDRSGVIASEKGEFWVFDKKTILEGLQPKLTLVALPKKWSVYVPTAREVSQYASKRQTPENFASDSVMSHYALLAHGLLADVLTRSEIFESELAAKFGTGPTYRRCSGPGRHRMPPTGVDGDGNCEIDHYPFA